MATRTRDDPRRRALHPPPTAPCPGGRVRARGDRAAQGWNRRAHPRPQTSHRHMTSPGPDGAALLGAGRDADVYACGDATVLKLYRPGFRGHRAEAATLRSLDGHRIAPRLLDVVDRDGR